ncbi:MAG: tetratricopeptide repeat protein [Thermoguttaceae bacterium]
MTTFLEQYDAAMEFRRRGETDAAWRAMRELASTKPDEPLVATALAAWHKKDGDLDEAIAHAENYCRLLPNDSFGFSVLSSYCIAAGRREDAEAALMAGQRARLAAHFPSHTQHSPTEQSDD